MEDIARYANRVLVMSKAKVAMYDTVEKVFARAPELLELGLSVPQVTQVFLMLKAMGMEIDTDVYTVPYAVKPEPKAKRILVLLLAAALPIIAGRAAAGCTGPAAGTHPHDLAVSGLYIFELVLAGGVVRM